MKKYASSESLLTLWIFPSACYENGQQSGWITSERWGKFLKGSKNEKYQEKKKQQSKPQYNLQVIKKDNSSHLP